MKVSDIVWMCFIVVALCSCMVRYTTEQEKKGVAISRFLEYYHNIEVSPRDAAYFTINISSIIQEEESIYDYR